jgi:hypothetical protein
MSVGPARVFTEEFSQETEIVKVTGCKFKALQDLDRAINA